MAQDYWANILTRRISRRRALAVSAGAGVGALILACAGGAEDGESMVSKDRSGLLVQPPLTTKNIANGGVWQIYRIRDPLHMNPLDAATGVLLHALNAYSQPVQFKTGTAEDLPDGTLEGDAAKSWERSPDGLQLTFKLRPDVKLDPRPPTDGRSLTTKDWLYSWEKFANETPNGADFSAKRDPNSPIESWASPDSQTVVIKLAYPYAPLLELFADSRYAFVIMPTEHDDQFDARTETRGSGPWMLTRWDQSSRLEWRRNPNYWDKPRPYLDGINEPIIPEYAQQMAQFRAGSIWSWANIDLRQEDVLGLKKDLPELNMWVNQSYRLSHTTGAPSTVAFSGLPNSPFRDIRVRRGLSMLVDRDLLMDTFNNLPAFREAGIDVQARWHTIVSCVDDERWLDPKGPDLGEAAKNFQYDPVEAGKLLKAAGINQLELPYHVSNSVNRNSETFGEMLQNGDFFKVKFTPHPQADFLANYHAGHGLWDGIAVNGGFSAVDPEFNTARYNPYSNFRNAPEALPYNDLLIKQRREFDKKKRAEIWKEIQRQWATLLQPDIPGPLPGIAQTINLAWPVFGNYGAVLPYASPNAAPKAWSHYWYDASKRKG
jgi:peptide/nickel transport system substrate-binding protein